VPPTAVVGVLSRRVSLSPYLCVSLSPHLCVSLSPHLCVSLSPHLCGFSLSGGGALSPRHLSSVILSDYSHLRAQSSRQSCQLLPLRCSPAALPCHCAMSVSTKCMLHISLPITVPIEGINCFLFMHLTCFSRRVVVALSRSLFSAVAVAVLVGECIVQ
jgi:hypothetical protein